MHLQSFGAAEEVTGSCHLIEANGHRVLLDCGLIQGRAEDEARNREPFSFEPASIDAVVLSHAHIDHSGRLPLLIKSGFKGPIYTQYASRDLCRIMLKDTAHLAERDAEWENRKRRRKHLPMVDALYDLDDVLKAMRHFRALNYDVRETILPGISIRLRDAGHILGSAIVEIWLEEQGTTRKLVFSGDLGQNNVPILRDVTLIEEADLVIMESTYGDRLHQTIDNTFREFRGILETACRRGGNVLIPAFAVGRSQEILYLFKKYFKDWQMDRWEVFLDSPMAIEATQVYFQHTNLHDEETSSLWSNPRAESLLPNLHLSHTANQSMKLNRIQSGAIIIAGSGMCNGGRIKHHFKHNIWRDDCHVVITGFQARGTLGRALVDGAKHIRLWGETIKVAAQIHTVGGLSAHADQNGLCEWYENFKPRPSVLLVHGEPDAQAILATRLRQELNSKVSIARFGERIDLL